MYDMTKYLNTIDQVIEKGPYKDNWASLTKVQVPSWFPKAKLGIFIHWGLYSIPQNSNEWYSRNMYIKGMPAYEHHIKAYGEQKDFGYKDFIPMFKAEKFNPKEWADLIEESGANYVFPVAEHHEGFQMYKSKISHYNAYEMGPKRDILGELKKEFESRGLIFCTSSHRAEHWFFMGHGKEFDSDIKEPLVRGDFYWPSMPEPDNMDLFSKPYPTEEYLQDWLVRTCEIIDQYQPKALYFDWWIQHDAFKPYLKKLAAYYYNRGMEWNKEVIICYKYDAMAYGAGLIEVERGKFAEVKPFYWQTDTSVAHNSWCYTLQNDYKTAKDIILEFVDIVSKNGNMLLNIGPKGDGSIPEEDASILKGLGAWLKVNGEAFFDSRVWKRSGEGPTKTKEGHFSDNGKLEYTSEDMRFTVREDYLYATALQYPEDGSIIITSLKRLKDPNQAVFHGMIKEVEVLGFEEEPTWEMTEGGLKIHTNTVASELPVVFKIQFA
ncbi:MAG: alpha-L-fucosidase [bacterium]|nr:alpha-L-fucosidase [bacterium]